MSEIMALCDLKSSAKGVDAGIEDSINNVNLAHFSNIASMAATKYNCTIIITGAIDIVANSKEIYFIYNGDKIMSQITGTGCMCTALVGTFLGVNNSIYSSISAIGLMGICGELAANSSKGLGYFKNELFSLIHSISEDTIRSTIKIKKL